jgi:hypothetical protein
MADKIEYAITGNPDDFLTAMQRINAAGQETFEKISAKAEGATAIVDRLSAAFAALTAILAGGEAFRESISKTVELAVNSQRLSREFNVTTQEASALGIALDEAHADTETFATAGAKLTSQLRKNESGLNKMGLATRDAHGNLRNMEDLMLDAIQVVNSYKEGTDRNAAAQVLFGRGAEELRYVLTLNTQALEEARQKAEALGLVQGPEQIANVKAYRAAMVDFGTSIDAIKNVAGQQFLPVLTRMAEFFAHLLPQALQVVKIAFFAWVGATAEWVEGVRGRWAVLEESALRLSHVISDALALNWDLIESDWKEGTARIEKVLQDSANRIRFLQKENEQTVLDILNGGDKPKIGGNTQAPPSGGRSFENPKAQKGARVQQWEEDLEAQKVAFALEQDRQGTFLEFGKAAEAAYWQDKLKTVGLSTQEKLTIERNYLTASSALHRQSAAEEFAGFKAQEEQYKNNLDARLALALQAQARAKVLYGSDSREYQQAAVEVIKIERQKQEQIKQIRNEQNAAAEKAALDQITFEERIAQLDVSDGLITQAELLQQQISFEQRRYAIARDGLAQRLELAKLDPDKNIVLINQINVQIEALERQHQQALGLIRKQAQVEARTDFRQTISQWQSTWTQGLARMLQGTLSFRNALRGLFNSILSGLADLAAKSVAKWAFKEAAQTSATVLGVGQRLAAEKAGAVQSLLLSAGAAIKDIINRAFQAAAGAYAAISAIPYVGPFLAPGIAAGTLATVIALGSSIVSAEGGYDIPGSINPLIQAHANEMVLPAKHADVIRSLADEGGGVGGDTYHITVMAHDATGFKKLVMDNAPTIGMAIKKHARNGGFS